MTPAAGAAIGRQPEANASDEASVATPPVGAAIGRPSSPPDEAMHKMQNAATGNRQQATGETANRAVGAAIGRPPEADASDELTVNCHLSLPPAWDALLSHPFSRAPHARPLAAAEAAAALETVYPPRSDWFAALRLTPPDRVRVVILGQDPYHEPDQAMGLAFSVRPGVRLPPSLRNIYKELESDLGLPAPPDGDLTPWAEQGVLLLNTVLTVAAGRANSHKNLGWQALTTEILAAVSRLPQPIAFLLWGAPAQKAFYQATGNRQQATGDGGCEASVTRQQATGDGGCESTGNRQQATGDSANRAVGAAIGRPPEADASDEAPVTTPRETSNRAVGAAIGRPPEADASDELTVNCPLSTVNCAPPRLILTAPHPSPLSAYRGFFGSRPFSRINAFLAAHGQKQIEWTGKEPL